MTTKTLRIRCSQLGGGLLILLGCLLACSKPPRIVTTRHTGDLGQFILLSVERYGGHAKTNSGLPRIELEWTAKAITGTEYLEDNEKLSIVVIGDHFPQLTNFLMQAYGPPSVNTTSAPTGTVYGGYLAENMGVPLQFYRNANETGVMIAGRIKK
jgi:hypothetical protein